jgi:hypothetical protein
VLTRVSQVARLASSLYLYIYIISRARLVYCTHIPVCGEELRDDRAGLAILSESKLCDDRGGGGHLTRFEAETLFPTARPLFFDL